MSGVKYEQLVTKADTEEDVITAKPKRKCHDAWCQKSLMSLGFILIYFSLSIGLTFYQRWLLKDFRYPLSVVMYHLIVKWALSVVVRSVRHLVTGTSQLVLPFMTCLRSVGPTGLASGIDVGFSNWGLGLVTISLYTMTKSTTIIFILGFAILLGLERKSWSLVGIVLMIATGLIMFTYQATQFNLLGFDFLLIASFAGGLRWTFAQVLMQKSKLGLDNPIDMVFHVQPWMFLSLMPFTIYFEGTRCFEYIEALPQEQLVPTLIKVSGGASIAFLMEVSEFLVVTYTSSLTLSIAGIFKEMCILVLAVEVSGDRLSPINVAGLGVCLLGITGHCVHKLLFLKSVTGTVAAIDDEFEPASRVWPTKDDGEPLLDDMFPHSSEESDLDANTVLFEVVQRRDGRYLTMGSIDADSIETCDSQTSGEYERLPESIAPTTTMFTAICMYPAELIGVLPKEAKDCINALVKVADDNELSIELWMIPHRPPAQQCRRKAFWERLRNKIFACGSK